MTNLKLFRMVVHHLGYVGFEISATWSSVFGLFFEHAFVEWFETTRVVSQHQD